MDVWIKSFFFFFSVFFLRPKSWGGLRLCLSLCSFPLGCNLPDALSPDLKWPQGMAYRWAPKLVCQEQAPGVAGPTLQGHLGSPWGGPSFQARGFCRGGPPIRQPWGYGGARKHPWNQGARTTGLSAVKMPKATESVQKVPEIFGNMLGIQTHTHTHTHGHFH